MHNCTIIGISDQRSLWLPPEVEAVIGSHRVFSGGRRHRAIMADRLPSDAVWIDITVPLSDVFRAYERYEDIVVFASGDPLFYGFAQTVQRECPGCTIRLYPSFNSLQTLAHRLLLPYQDMHVVSLTGRPWRGLDEALISGYGLIGVLTDGHRTPLAILQRMADYGYTNYTMTVGERLGNADEERITTLDVCSKHNTQPLCDFASPNCVILRRTSVRPRPFGLPEQDFALLDGRARMITKMPIRLLSLSMLDLRHRHVFWDVGFCTGSVSIEAKLQFPHLDVHAFEQREEGRRLMADNARRFGTPGIEAHIGDFLVADVDALPRPDAVFIGGHGGRLSDMLQRVARCMNPGGVVVFNSVSDASRQQFYDGVAQAGLCLDGETRMAIDDHNPIYVLRAVRSS